MRSIIKKKGLSPIIATSLLIAIAVVLGLIIWIWARNFVGEVLQKNDSPIEESCSQITFLVDVSSSTATVENTGNIPIYGIEIKKFGLGSVESKGVFTDRTIQNGQTADIELDVTLNSNEEVQVIPIIIGESGNTKQEYSCTSQAQTTTVI